MPSDSAKIEITQPRLFTTGAVAVVNAYGILLITPIFSAIIVVSVIKLGVLTVLIPLLVLAATAFFLPFGLGNTHVTRLVRSLNPGAGQERGRLYRSTDRIAQTQVGPPGAPGRCG